jgi:hypothetical protein
MVVYGGVNLFDPSEVWALSLSEIPAWSRFTPSGTPPPGRGPAIYDPMRDRMVFFGGATPSVPYSNETWALSLDGGLGWSKLAPSEAPPEGRANHTATYDPARDRMIVFGGAYVSVYDDTWALGWGDPVKPSVACMGDPSWVAGTSVEVRYLVSNPLPSDRVVNWMLTSARDWPGLPIRGSRLLRASATETLTVRVPVPDTAAAGANHLIFTAAYAGAAGNNVTCEHDITNALTSTLASLVSVEAKPDQARLVWQVSAGGPVTVYRRRPATAWAAVKMMSVDGVDVTFEDRAVEPGERYGYRLGWASERGEIVAGEVWVDVPRAIELALHGVRPNPAARDLAVSFTLPSAGPVRLDFYDLAGRRVSSIKEAVMSAGYHLVPVSSWSQFSPGVFVARLWFAGRTLQTRAVVIK